MKKGLMLNEELIPTNFQTMADAILSEGYDKVDVTEFFGILAAMDWSEQESIEFTAYIETGKAFDAFCDSEPLP